jgi:hypothetical protein
MAIIVKNQVIGGVQAPPRSLSKTKVSPQPDPETQILTRRFVIEPKKTNGVASQDTALVVNGKQKSIGRKSHYLLDMLTLDDE